MSSVQVVTIKCDGWTVKGVRCAESLSMVGTLINARANARSHGWIYRGKKDLCPSCRAVERVN